MYFSLFIASALMALGCIVFGAFEVGQSLWIRITKFAVLLGVTALLERTVGQGWALAWVFGMFGVGLGFHTWWTRRNGIDFLRPEPREKYYALRGWQ